MHQKFLVPYDAKPSEQHSVEIANANEPDIRIIRGFHGIWRNDAIYMLHVTWLSTCSWAALKKFTNHLSVHRELVRRAQPPSWRAGYRPYQQKSTRIHRGHAWHMNRNSSPRCSAMLARKQYRTPAKKGWAQISKYRNALRNRTKQTNKENRDK